MERRYCTLCGKRMVRIIDKETYEYNGVSYTAIWYFSDTSEAEPICLGHNAPPRMKVPQAFYTALSDEEVAL